MTSAQPPTWILFDADGVVQGTRDGWLAELTAAGGARGQEFVLAVFAAEQSSVTGADFTAAINGVLRDFGVDAPLTQVIPPDFWIEVDREVLAAVADLRASGIRCGLATTQSDLRGAYMQEQLAGVFDESFYSYELGHAKPDPAFFAAVLERLGVPADQVLFIDDAEANVAGAAAAGLRAELFPRDGGVAALRAILARHAVRL